MGLPTWIIVVISLIASSQAQSSGMVLHMWMADQAVEYIEDLELKELLSHERNAYLYGSIFPDTGYAINHPYGEIAHWDGFMNAYHRVVHEDCSNLVTTSCRSLYAHLLGSVSHSIADINFDGKFIPKAAQVDYGGDIDRAQKWIDIGLDMVALMAHGRGLVQPQWNLPTQLLAKVFGRLSEANVSAADLRRGARRHRLGMAGEPVAAAMTYHFYRSHVRWASQNMIESPGGVKDTARKIAQVWEILWKARRDGRGDEQPFATPGRWPYKELWVYGHQLLNPQIASAFTKSRQQILRE